MIGKKAANLFVFMLLVVVGGHDALIAQSIKFRFPRPGQTFYADRVLRLEWSKEHGDDSVDVLYSQDEGASWTALAVGMQDSAYNWRVPLLDTSGVRFKVVTTSLLQPFEFQHMIRERGARSVCLANNDRTVLSTLEGSLLESRSSDLLVAVATQSLGSPELCAARAYPNHPDTTISAQRNEILLCDINSFGSVLRFGAEEGPDAITALCVHPSLELMATTTSKGKVCIWSLAERKVVARFQAPFEAALRTVAFSADGSQILYAGDEGVIYVRNWTDTSQSVKELRGHGDGGQNMAVYSAAFTPDGNHVVSGGEDYTVRVWELQFQSCTNILYGHVGRVTSLSVSADGTRILSGSSDSTVRQWSIAAGRELHAPLVTNDAISSVWYSQGADTLVASEEHSGTTHFWKNARIAGSSDSVTGYIRYPISIRICNTHAQAGEYHPIPIVFDSIVSVPMFRRSRFEATLGLTVPRTVIDVRTDDAHYTILRGDDRDTVFMPVTFSSNDTIGYLPARFLLSDAGVADISMLPGKLAIQWSENVRAFTLDHVTNGTVESSKECPSIARGGLSMALLEDASIAPLPADRSASLRFSAYEQGNYRIEILNEMGMLAGVVYDAEVPRGEQEVPLQCSQLASGCYHLRIVAPSTIKTLPLLIVH